MLARIQQVQQVVVWQTRERDAGKQGGRLCLLWNRIQPMK